MNGPEPTSKTKAVKQEPIPPFITLAPDKEKEPEQHAKMQALVKHVPAIQALLRPHGIEEAHIVPSTIVDFDFFLHISPEFQTNRLLNDATAKLQDVTEQFLALRHLNGRRIFFGHREELGHRPITISRSD